MLPIFLLIYFILLLSRNPFCKYLGVIVDDKLKFFSPYTECSIKTRSSLWCNIKNETLCAKIHPTEILYVEYQANNTIWLARLRRHEFFFFKPNFEYATKNSSHDLLQKEIF